MFEFLSSERFGVFRKSLFPGCGVGLFWSFFGWVVFPGQTVFLDYAMLLVFPWGYAFPHYLVFLSVVLIVFVGDGLSWADFWSFRGVR